MSEIKNIFEKLKKAKRFWVMLVPVLLLSACDGCPTVQDYASRGQGSNCLLCPIFDILTQSSASAAQSSWNTFAGGLANVVLFATAIHIAFNTLKSLGSFGKLDVATYLTADKKGILMLIFKMAVIYALLQDATFFVDKIIKPILEAGLSIGIRLASDSGSKSSFEAGASGGGWTGLFSMINDGVVGYNDAVYENIALGQSMICNATDDFIFFWYWLMLLYGFLFFVFGWAVLVAVCFYLVDVLINLAIASMLLPFGIAFMISPQTSQHCQKIWNMFLDVFFNFMMLGVILGVSVKLALVAMGDYAGAGLTDMVSASQFSGSIQGLLDRNEVEAASEILWSSGSLLLTIVCFCLIANILATFKNIVKDISGVESGSSAGSQTAAPLAKKAMEGGQKMGKHAVDIAKSAGKYGGHVVARITRLDKGMRHVRNGLNTARGFLTGTGSKGYKAWWRKF
jgi:hypothetical protein